MSTASGLVTKWVTWPFTDMAQRINSRFALSSRWDETKTYAQEKPMRALFYSALFVMAFVPIVTFVIIIVSSLIIGLATLLCIQGVVLTMSLTVLTPVLAVVVLCSFGLTVMAMMSKYAYRFAIWAWSVICGSVPESVREPVSNFVVKSATHIANLNIKGSFTLPAVRYRLTRKTANGTTDCKNGTAPDEHGDYPRFHAQMMYKGDGEELQKAAEKELQKVMTAVEKELQMEKQQGMYNTEGYNYEDDFENDD